MSRILFCLTLLAVGPTIGIGQVVTLAPSDNPTNRTIEELVAQERHIVFDNATLRDVVTFLEECGIPAHLDLRAIEDVGLGDDAPVTFKHQSIRLSDGLHLLLRRLDLTWAIRHGRLIITTPEEDEMNLITKVYDVRNLVELVPEPYWNGDYETLPTTVYRYDFDSLLDLIETTVAPDTWDSLGGPGTLRPYWTRHMRVIVISQTYEVHQKIVSLLHKLAERGGRSPIPPAPAYRLPTPRRHSPAIFGNGFFNTSGIHTSRLRTTGQ